MDTDTHRYRVLLAEDDPLSREFLGEALRACGVDFSVCVDGPTALECARAGGWDLLLLDHDLPGLTGDAILTALVNEPGLCSPRPPAIAITAAPDDHSLALRRAGFAEILPKPLTIAALRAALQRHGGPDGQTLDDGDALRACGSADIVARLRRLFIEQEIPAIFAELEHCRGALQKLRPSLHRLRASCGFCGAAELAHASAALHRALATDDDPEQVEQTLSAFRMALVETRGALYASLDPQD